MHCAPRSLLEFHFPCSISCYKYKVGNIERLATFPPVQLIGGVGPAADLPVPKPDAQPLRRAGLAPAGGVPGHPSSGATALPFRVAIKSRINSDTSSRSAI